MLMKFHYTKRNPSHYVNGSLLHNTNRIHYTTEIQVFYQHSVTLPQFHSITFIELLCYQNSINFQKSVVLQNSIKLPDICCIIRILELLEFFYVTITKFHYNTGTLLPYKNSVMKMEFCYINGITVPFQNSTIFIDFP